MSARFHVPGLADRRESWRDREADSARSAGRAVAVARGESARGTPPDEGSSIVALPDEEAHHLARVLRLVPGDRVRVFDGRGREWEAAVASVTARAARVRLIGPVAPRPEASVAVTLAVARLSGEKMDGVVRDAVMLGVSAIRPFVSAHTARPRPLARERAARARWERVAVASAKQCGRAVVPRIAEAVPAEAILAATDEMRLLLVEPGASAVERLSLRKIATLGTPASATLAVGPEGGWRPDELKQAASLGWRLLQLGPRTLRAEAVPIVALSAVLAMWGEL